jgi:uncharacterized glyoxalase superfamily protein PhnB
MRFQLTAAELTVVSLRDRRADIKHALSAPERNPRVVPGNAIEALLRVSIGGMKPNRSIPAATVIPVLIYPNVREAVAWLCAAFGFVERVRIGQNHRAQLRFGDGAVIVGDARGDRRPPRDDEVTHSVVRVDDVRAHCERARENGAHILMEPTDFEYGERQYSAADPAGDQWTFSETLADVAPRGMGRRILQFGMTDRSVPNNGSPSWLPEPEQSALRPTVPEPCGQASAAGHR